jgi:photosynthetic reaction center cytochrome c subunit
VLALIISSDLNKTPDFKPKYADFVTEQILSKDTTNTYGENLQVLHGIHSKAQLLNVMRGFSEALGVQCDFCHNTDNFASDAKMPKRMARIMIKMVRNIDENYLNQPMMKKVTCFTCHRGQEIPKLVAER